MSDNNSLSHTTWNCKYHIVFAPKYRRKTFYGSNRAEIGSILRELCKWKGVNIINAYITNQLREDELAEQLTIDKIDPFTGSRR